LSSPGLVPNDQISMPNPVANQNKQSVQPPQPKQNPGQAPNVHQQVNPMVKSSGTPAQMQPKSNSATMSSGKTAKLSKKKPKEV